MRKAQKDQVRPQNRRKQQRKRRDIRNLWRPRMESLEDRIVLTGAPPVAMNDVFTVFENETLSAESPGILANDSDAEGDVLTTRMFSDVRNGSLTLNEDGSFQYTPQAGFLGFDSFTYSANDGTSDSLLAAVTIHVVPIDVEPDAANDAFQTDEDNMLSVSAEEGVLANDSHPAGLPLTAQLVGGAANGTVTLNADGSFEYVPNENFYGTDGFSYVADDGTNTSAVASVTLTVSPVNDIPQTAADSYSTEEDTALVVNAPGLLSNDSDIEGEALSAIVVDGPQNGSLTLNADGSFSYTPNADYFGMDSFTYVANDGSDDSDVTVVNIDVTPVNDPPAAVNDQYTTAEDTELLIDTSSGLLANDSDVDGDQLTVAVVNGPQNGSLTLNPDGSFSYTPNANFFGSDGFSYVANDGTTDSEVATVTIDVTPVNDAPSVADDAYTVAEDAELLIDAASGVLANDSDVDGDGLSAILVDSPQNGSLTLNADGSFSYTPNADFNGTDTFTYVANDGTVDSSLATVTIDVTPVNDAPSVADDAYTVAEDAELLIDAAGGVLANDSDPDGDGLSAILVDSTQNGSLTLNADGSFSYTPNADFNGSDTFTYVANDGTVDSSLATVTIDVTSVNDIPVATNDQYTVAEDAELVVDAASGLLANDSDADGDALSAVLVDGPQNGSVTLNADGSFTYTPDADFFGSDGFSYVADDGTVSSDVATVTIEVTPTNDIPVATNDQYTVEEDSSLVVDAAGGLLANDSDPDGDVLSAMLVDGPQSGSVTLNADGSFTYTPDADFHGSDGFSYVANDGTSDSDVATVTIDVTPVNDSPVATADAYATDEDTELVVDAASGVLANDTDLDGDGLSAVLVSGPQNGSLTLNADGSFSYTPNADFHGSDSFTYVANDGSLDSEPATVTIDVASLNDPPFDDDDSLGTGHDDHYSIGEDLVLAMSAAMGVLRNDFDPDDDPLTASLQTGPSHGTLDLQSDGSFTYTPEANYFGPDSFVYLVSDGELETEKSVGIVVEPINDFPVAVDDEYAVGTDGTLDVPAGTGVLGNDEDIENDPLVGRLLRGPAHGTLTFNNDGSFQYTAHAGYSGGDSFIYQAFDGKADSNPATVTLMVEQSMVAADDAYTTAEDEVLNVPVESGVLSNDQLNGQSLAATLVSGPEHGSLNLAADGSFEYTPDANFNGSDSFVYAVDGSEQATVSLTVTAVNDAPEAAADQYTLMADVASTIAASEGVLANDTDVDGDTLQASLVDAPSNGSLTLNADGSFQYTPAGGFVGADSFTYTAGDGDLSSSPVAVNIIVTEDEPTGDNEPPVAMNDTYNVAIDGNLVVDAEDGLLENDSDPNLDPLSVSMAAGPNSGSLVLNADGSFTYTPNPGFFGIDGFSYIASDGELVSDVATVTINVIADNGAPIARNDSFVVERDQTLMIDATLGLLANDEDPDGDGMSVSLFSGASQGTLTLNDDGSFSYVPNSGFVGTDSFVYQVDDQISVSNLAAVTLHVVESNSAPLTLDPVSVPNGGEVDLSLDVAAEHLLVGIDIWAQARPDLAEAFATVYVTIGNLPQGRLGQTFQNHITLDDDAAGMGWGLFDDANDAPDPERIDLLTVVLHELGHVAGLEDVPVSDETEDVMEAFLPTGVRRTPMESAIDALMANDDWLS